MNNFFNYNPPKPMENLFYGMLVFFIIFCGVAFYISYRKHK